MHHVMQTCIHYLWGFGSLAGFCCRGSSVSMQVCSDPAQPETTAANTDLAKLSVMSDVSIRQASVEDVEVITPLFGQYLAFYRQPENSSRARNFLQERLSKQESVVFLAYVGEEAVGMAQLYPLFSSLSMGGLICRDNVWQVIQRQTD